MGGFLVVVLLSLLGIVLANDQFNIFSSPPEGSFLTWRAGTTQTVSWTTACQTGYNITLWQQAAEGGSASLIAVIYIANNPAPGPQSFSWVVDLGGADLSYSNQFFLWANHGLDPNWNSAYITMARAAAVTAGKLTTTATSPTTNLPAITVLPTATNTLTSILFDHAPPKTTLATTSSTGLATTSSGTLGAPTSTLPAASNSTSNNSQPKDGSASPDTQSTPPTVWIGVAVGVGLTLLLVIGVLAYALWRRRKASAVSLATGLPPYDPATGHEYRGQISELAGSDISSTNERHEKSGSPTAVYHEVDGQRPIRELP